MPCLRSCILCCLLVVGLGAADLPAPPPAQGLDMREALASTTRERDELIVQVDRLEHQRSLLIAVAGLLMIAVGLLVRAHLTARRKGVKTSDIEAVEIDESDPFPEAAGELLTATTVTMRKNATITIRNGSTQREEVTEQVQTRRFFSPGETRRTTRRESTTAEPSQEEATPAQPPPPAPTSTDRVTRTITRQSTQRVAAPVNLSAADATDGELKPSTDRVPRKTTDPGANVTEGPRRPATVRVDHQSDRMDVVEVTVKPGTTGVYRRQAFTLLEVMISIALLATVLSSVVASTYTLHHSRMMAEEDAESRMLGRLFVERIMAESWGNLTDNQVGSLWRVNFADAQGAVPLTADVLKTKNLVEEVPALNDLKVYIEKYRQSAAEDAIRNNLPLDTTAANRTSSWDRTLVFRIVIDWVSCDGNPRRHTQLFIRSE